MTNKKKRFRSSKGKIFGKISFNPHGLNFLLNSGLKLTLESYSITTNSKRALFEAKGYRKIKKKRF